MKNIAHFLLFLCLVGLFLSCDTFLQEKKMTITTNSKEALKYFLDGREKFNNVENVAARDFFDEAISRDPEFALAYLYRALNSGNIEESRKFLGKAYALLNQVSEEESEFIKYYKSLFDADGKRQKEYLTKLEQMLPGDPQVLNELGIYYYALVNDYNKALSYFQRVVEIEPKFGSAYNLIGYSQIQLGDYDAAEMAFLKYIDMCPTSPNPYDSYAELLLKRGKYEESIQNYQKAYDTDNKFTVALRGIGINYAMKGDFESARSYFNQAEEKARLVSEKFAAIALSISSYVEQGDIDQAIKLCDQRFELAKETNHLDNQISSMNMAAFIFRETGDFEKAQEYYDLVNSLVETGELEDADRDSYRLMVGWSECIMLAAQQRMAEANSQAENCLKWAERRADPSGLINAYGQMGQLSVRQNNFEKALEYLQRADQGNPYYWYQMALAYKGQNMTEKAAQWFSRVANENDLQLGLALVRKKAQEQLK